MWSDVDESDGSRENVQILPRTAPVVGFDEWTTRQMKFKQFICFKQKDKNE